MLGMAKWGFVIVGYLVGRGGRGGKGRGEIILVQKLFSLFPEALNG